MDRVNLHFDAIPYRSTKSSRWLGWPSLALVHAFSLALVVGFPLALVLALSRARVVSSGFAVHLNALLLAYCAALTLPLVALVALVALAPILSSGDLTDRDIDSLPAHTVGIFLTAAAALLATACLAEILPAIAHGAILNP